MANKCENTCVSTLTVEYFTINTGPFIYAVTRPVQARENNLELSYIQYVLQGMMGKGPCWWVGAD
jgi:hypothetical protein